MSRAKYFPSLLAGLIASVATISPAHATLDVVTEDFELIFIAFDQVAKITYYKDLGVSAKQFWLDGQQDNGASLFLTLDPATDPALQTFAAAAQPSNTRWALLGFYNAPAPELLSFYSTLTNNNSVAKQTESFDKLRNTASSGLTGNAAMTTLLGKVNANTAGDFVSNTFQPASANGSAVADKSKGSTATLESSNGWSVAGDNNVDGDCLFSGFVCVGNPLGTSSWFYKTTPKLIEGEFQGSDPVVHDEFDNLTHDGFWGFVKDPASSKFFLSYTLPGANPTVLASTDAGRFRLSTIDYSAQSGGARLIGGLAADDVAFQLGTVSAVPEPESWGLMLAGLATLAGARRLRRARQG